MVTNFNIPVDDEVAQRAKLLKDEEVNATWSETFEELVRVAEAVAEARDDDRKALSLVAEELAERDEQPAQRRREVEVEEARAVADPDVTEASSESEPEEPEADQETKQDDEDTDQHGTSPPASYDPDAETPRSVDDLVEIGAEEIPGSPGKKRQREKSLHAALEYLRDNGTATPSDLQSAVYSNGLTGSYQSARSWWKNCIYKAFSRIAEESDVIEKPDHTGEWQWAGD